MTTTNLTSDEREPTISTGGESLSIFEIMQRYRNDGSCEHVIEDALRRLSLLASQAADYQRPVGWQDAMQRADPRRVFITFETRECAEAFMRGLKPTEGPGTAAARMRDKCVQMLRELAEDYDSSWARRALKDAAREVESLTLDQTEQETK